MPYLLIQYGDNVRDGDHFAVARVDGEIALALDDAIRIPHWEANRETECCSIGLSNVIPPGPASPRSSRCHRPLTYAGRQRRQ